MKIYKGYIETKGEVPVKGQNLVNRTDFPDLNYMIENNVQEFSAVLDDNIVLFNFNGIEAEKALEIIKDFNIKCRVLKTDNGIHCLLKTTDKFSKNFNEKQLCCGLIANIRLGSKNGLECLRKNGNDYEIIRDNLNYDFVPGFFEPTTIKRDNNINFYKMNNEEKLTNIKKYSLFIKKILSDKDEIIKSLKILNKYILECPSLNDEKIEALYNSEELNNEKSLNFYSDRHEFMFDEFAKFLVMKSNIIKINNVLHVYHDGIYVNGQDYLEREMIKYIPRLTDSKRKETIKYINLLIKDNTRSDVDSNLIAFKNGVYDILTDKLLPFNEDYIITNKINWDFDKDAYSEICDKTLNKLACNNKEIRDLIDEMIGYCFYRKNELGKSFMLVGDKANGKSTLESLIQYLLSDENVSSLDLCELSEKFKNAELVGMLANIGDDIGDQFIVDNSIFKKLVTGEYVTVERKGERPFKFANYCKFIFSANTIPRMRDRTGAIKRRMIIIPFEATFSPSDPDFDPYIKYKLRDEQVMSYLINIGIKGLKRVLENDGFTICQKVEDRLEQYDKENNPIKLFFEDLDPFQDVYGVQSSKLYDEYKKFCMQNNFSAMSNIEFSKMVNKEFNTITKTSRKNGEIVRTFYRK